MYSFCPYMSIYPNCYALYCTKHNLIEHTVEHFTMQQQSAKKYWSIPIASCVAMIRHYIADMAAIATAP